jgi:putative ABC transport system permease protein
MVFLSPQSVISMFSDTDEENSFYLTSSGFTDSFNPRVTIEQDLAILRGMPGITNKLQVPG